MKSGKEVRMTRNPMRTAAAAVALVVAAAAAEQEARDVLADTAWDAADEDTPYLPDSTAREDGAAR